MKKVFIPLAVLAVLVPAVAGAQVNVNTSASVRLPAQAGAELGAEVRPYKPLPSVQAGASSTIRADIKTRVDALKTDVRARFGAGIQIAVGNIVDRLSNVVDHLATMATRIEAYIAAKKEAGMLMPQSAAALATATANIRIAGESVVAAEAALSAALSAPEPRQEFAKVRAAVKAAEEALKTAKLSLQETLKTIRAEMSAESSASVQ